MAYNVLASRPGSARKYGFSLSIGDMPARTHKKRHKPKSSDKGGIVATIKTLTMPDGTQVKAQEVAFRVEEEHWNVYALEDGTRVRLRTVAVKMLQILDERGEPARTPDGDPSIIVNHQTSVIASG
jgi:hypothetical protein